jgi:hypothetical protein
LDSSVNSIKDEHLNYCFGDIKTIQLGGLVQRTFVNKIAIAEARMNENFKEICERYNAEEILNSNITFTASKRKISSETDQEDNNLLNGLKEIVTELKQKEIDEIKDAILYLLRISC